MCHAGGICACPSGQTDCSGTCWQIGAACTVGIGPCARSGTVVCSGSSTACSAVAGTPGTETCNGVDDDCDGTTDEAPATSNSCPSVGTCKEGACECPIESLSGNACGSHCHVCTGALSCDYVPCPGTCIPHTGCCDWVAKPCTGSNPCPSGTSWSRTTNLGDPCYYICCML